MLPNTRNLYYNQKFKNFNSYSRVIWNNLTFRSMNMSISDKKETSRNIGHQASAFTALPSTTQISEIGKSVHNFYQINIIIIISSSSGSSYSIAENKIPPAVFIVYSYTNTQWYLTLHKLFSGLTGFLFTSHAYRIIRRSSSPGLSSNPRRKKRLLTARTKRHRCIGRKPIHTQQREVGSTLFILKKKSQV